MRADGWCGSAGLPYKGFDVLVRVAVDRSFEVWIVGEGRERLRLEELIKSLGVQDRVRLLGSVLESERMNLMCIADVFVMPSVSNAETFRASSSWKRWRLGGRSQHRARHCRSASRSPRHRGGHRAARRSQKLWGINRQPERRPGTPPADGRAARHRAMTKYSTAAFSKGIATIYREAAAAPAPTVRAPHEPPRSDGHTSSRSRRRSPGPTCAIAMSAHRSATISGCRSRWRSWWRCWAPDRPLLQCERGLSSPTLALSLTAWTFLNSVVLDATTALQNSASLIKDVRCRRRFLLQCVFRSRCSRSTMPACR